MDEIQKNNDRRAKRVLESDRMNLKPGDRVIVTRFDDSIFPAGCEGNTGKIDHVYQNGEHVLNIVLMIFDAPCWNCQRCCVARWFTMSDLVDADYRLVASVKDSLKELGE